MFVCLGVDLRSCAVYRSPPLRSLERSHDLLMDDPFRRQNAQVKCAIAVHSMGLSLFGLYFGYCLGGSNDPRDFEAQLAGGCSEDGRGAYDNTNRLFLMSVYEIKDPQQFDEVVMVGVNGTVMFNTTVEETQGSGASRPWVGGGGGGVLSVALLALSVVTLVL